MTPRPSLPVRFALAAIRLVSLVVPRRERTAWRQEWTGELMHGQADAARRPATAWSHDMSLVRRSLGSLKDAAWLRRQFTRDSELAHDLRQGARILRRQPGFSFLAGLVLALGIGATTAVLTVATTLLASDSPFPEGDRLVAVWVHDTSDPEALRGEVAPGTFVDWLARASAFDGLAGIEPYAVDYSSGDRPEVLFASLVTDGFFDVLGITPAHGRLFRPDDHVSGAAPVVVLGRQIWEQRFASDPSLVGQAITLDGQPVTVAGILRDDPRLDLLGGSRRRGVWLPKFINPGELRSRGVGWWGVVGRLAPGITLDAARADMARVSADLAREFPRANEDIGAWVEPLGAHQVARARPALALLLGAVSVVLLIACANVANMMLARAAGREREFAVRCSLGAGRARLVRQMLAETGLLAFLGVAAGVGLSIWLIGVARALAPASLPRLADVQADWRLVGVAAATGIVSTLLAGLIPALRHARARGTDALTAGRGSTGTRRSRLLGDGLAVAEIALAVTLVVGAGLLLRSFGRILAVDPGFDTERVLALQVFAYDRQNADPARRIVFFQETIADLRRLPGVVDAGAVSAMPLIEANIDIRGPIQVEGRVQADDAPEITSIAMATPGYFSVMEIPILRGRALEDTDGAAAERVAVVSEPLARRLWPDRDPIDTYARLTVFGQPIRVRIVGITGALRHDGLDRPVREEIFVPHAQAPSGSMTYVIRTSGDPAAVVTAAQQAIWAHDPLQTFYESTTVEDLVSSSVAPRRFSLVLVGLFAGIALVLAGAGIYGVLSYTTERRLPEFGMRIALGATSRDLGRLVLGRGLRLGLAGLAIGLALAAAASRVLESLLFDVSVFDPLTLAAVSIAVIALAAAACYVPARRAMRVDPLSALNQP